MDTHPTDPTALIAGLFFGFAGLAILADQQWEEVDVTAFTAAGVMLIGLLLLGVVIARAVQATTTPATPVSDTRYRDIADAADSGDRGGDEAGEPLGVEVGDEITVVGPGEVEGGTEELGVTDPEVG